MSKPSFRGARKKARSIRGRRLTPAERVAKASECKHKRFRYRNRSTEAVCLDCGAVQKIAGTGGNIEVTRGWELEGLEEIEHDELCSCAVCHFARLQGKDVKNENGSGTDSGGTPAADK